MFFVIIPRVRDKVLLLMRLILIFCILLLLSVQLFSVISSGVIAGGWLHKLETWGGF